MPGAWLARDPSNTTVVTRVSHLAEIPTKEHIQVSCRETGYLWSDEFRPDRIRGRPLGSRISTHVLALERTYRGSLSPVLSAALSLCVGSRARNQPRDFVE